ncbi:MAG: peptidylprolyl isomerase [Bacteroidetes bacterium 4572_77]|nr:MAG: peptidylprolyl isomerase [Bacteroidetes bacterium 4572_77]
MQHIPKLIAILFILSLVSCNKDDDKDNEVQLAEDIAKIENYLEEHHLEATKTASGLFYIISSPGSGTHPDINSNVTVNYTGKLIDGSVFDSGVFTSPLRNLIQGWQEGIPLLGSDGRCRLFIPSTLGYGANAQSGIPANSVLIFDIHLISFE